MEEYRFKWQIFVGAAVLLLFVATLFMPRLYVSGDKYVDMAVSVNEYARDKDKDKADAAGAKKIIDDYGEESEQRTSLVEKYDKSIKEKTGDHGTISGLFLGKWALKVEDTLYFDGITYKKDKKIEDSGVQTEFKLMGVLIYLPIVFALCLVVFMLVRRQTYGVFLIISGGLGIVCEAVLYFALPSMVWSKGKDCIESFSQIDKGILEIEGAGKETIIQIFHRFSSFTGIVVSALGGVLIILGILFLTVLRPKAVEDEDEFDFIFKQQSDWPAGSGMGANVAVNQNGAAGSFGKPFAGQITGVFGQYSGQSVQMSAGEEIILGRDPKYCMLVLEYPKISRRHCGIRYDIVSGKYQVIDYSSNGTRLSDGTIISTSQYTPVSPGAVLYLGNAKEAFRLE